MRLFSSERGVHPPDGKHFTANKKIETIMPKVGQLLYFPTSQHAGTPTEPIVAVGDYVKVGQKICDSDAKITSPVFSSVSGVVKAIKPVLLPAGNLSNAVIIENDGKFEKSEEIGKPYDYTKMTKEEIVDVIKKMGIVGLGGAGFPTYAKINPPADKKIDYYIVNGAECEPYLTTDDRMMIEHSDSLIRGILIFQKMYPDAKALIGIEDNKPTAIEVMRKAAEGYDKIEVVPVKTMYPQGGDKQLLRTLTGRTFPITNPPSRTPDTGCIVNNVVTIMAIDKALNEGEPFLKRVITVTGDAVKNPGNYEVCLGTTYQDLIDAIGGFKAEPKKFIAGGPMMGFSMYTLDVATIKTSSGLICLTEAECENPKESNCIRCGKCTEHCPLNLAPYALNQYALRGDAESFVANNGMFCIECGTCSYTCPSKRQLTQSISAMKRTESAKRKRR